MCHRLCAARFNASRTNDDPVHAPSTRFVDNTGRVSPSCQRVHQSERNPNRRGGFGLATHLVCGAAPARRLFVSDWPDWCERCGRNLAAVLGRTNQRRKRFGAGAQLCAGCTTRDQRTITSGHHQPTGLRRLCRCGATRGIYVLRQRRKSGGTVNVDRRMERDLAG